MAARRTSARKLRIYVCDPANSDAHEPVAAEGDADAALHVSGYCACARPRSTPTACPPVLRDRGLLLLRQRRRRRLLRRPIKKLYDYSSEELAKARTTKKQAIIDFTRAETKKSSTGLPSLQEFDEHIEFLPHGGDKCW